MSCGLVALLTVANSQANAAFVYDEFDGSFDETNVARFFSNSDPFGFDDTGTFVENTGNGGSVEYSSTLSVFESFAGDFNYQYINNSTVDLTQGGETLLFEFSEVSVSPNLNGSFNLTVFLQSPGESAFQTFDLTTLNDAGEGAVAFALSDFETPNFDVDETAVTLLRWNISTNNLSGDEVQSTATLERISVVPVPAALPLFVSGLAGLGYLASRRRRAEAT
jgi:hypothetical protein